MNLNICASCANKYDDNACNLCEMHPYELPSNYREMPEEESTNCISRN